MFYNHYGQRPAWLSPVNNPNLEQLIANINEAPYLGLERQDYLPSLLQTLESETAQADLVTTDARITAIAIQFFSDVAYGRLDRPAVKFNGPSYQPDCNNIAVKLAAYLTSGTFSSCLPEMEPATPEYTAVKDKIALFYSAVADSGHQDAHILSYRTDTTNQPLITRLRQLNILDDTTVLTSRILAEKLRIAQRMYNLLDDGTLRNSVTKALNIPFAQRLRELNQTINQLRWLHCCRQQGDVVVVNIPSCNLVLYQQNKPVLSSRVVTGKRSARTPTLCSRITDIILYPYWTVPKGIAARELLPHIQQNISYLSDNQFQVLDNRGNIVDPARINWQSLHAGYFPYTLRQGTGCDNSLGIIKLDFYNPYSVYLHDTPWKSLFMLNQRFFSHGCIRVEEALPLARLLLKDKAALLDTLIARGEQPKPVPLKPDTPAWVFVLYNTAWPDNQGNVRFYDDIYQL